MGNLLTLEAGILSSDRYKKKEKKRPLRIETAACTS